MKPTRGDGVQSAVVRDCNVMHYYPGHTLVFPKSPFAQTIFANLLHRLFAVGAPVHLKNQVSDLHTTETTEAVLVTGFYHALHSFMVPWFPDS